MKEYIFLFFVTIVASLSACVDDKGNYDYLGAHEVEIKFQSVNSGVVNTSLKIVPLIKYVHPEDSVYYKYEWRMNDTLVMEGKELTYTGREIKTYRFQFSVTDTRSDIQYLGYTMLTFQSPYKTGFLILYKDENNVSRLGFVKVQDIFDMGDPVDYPDYRAEYDLYKQYNGEDMGSDPQKLIQHFSSSNGGMGDIDEILVIQNGGQGALEIDGTTLRKSILTSEEFVNGIPPANLRPKDVWYHKTINLLLNEDGNLYGRFLTTHEGFHSNAYTNVPMTLDIDNGVSGGKVSALVQSIYTMTDITLLHDSQNKRLLLVASFDNNVAGMAALSHEGGWPETYVPLDNLGNMEIVYAGTYNDYGDGMSMTSSSSYLLLFKNPAGQYMMESFMLPYGSGGSVKITPGDQLKEFPGSSYITEKSKFFMFRTGEYMFFSGGVANDVLYCYNLLNNSISKFKSFDGRSITTIVPNEGYTYSLWSGYPGIGIGLESGDFYFYDASDQAIFSEAPTELCHYPGFGKIVDVLYKYTSEWLFWQ